MRVCGIIAEYNPFHKGHEYHLEACRKRTGADYLIVAMSGNFVQRGAPALLEKRYRAEMALRCGADLVLELPTICATGSAELFASGAVALLDKLGVIDDLCFGSECGSIEPLREAARVLAQEPEGLKLRLRAHLSLGEPYPAARQDAFRECFPASQLAANALSSPNNILGIEYLKALQRRKSAINPCTIQRLGAPYHGDDADDGTGPAREDAAGAYAFPSALSLRRQIYHGASCQDLEAQMPKAALTVLQKGLQDFHPMRTDDFSLPLYYKLLSEETTGFSGYLDVGDALSDRIQSLLYRYEGFEAFCGLLKTRDMIYTRISRCLLHILLNLHAQDLERMKGMDLAPYARILGFRKDAAPLFAALKANASIPLLSKLADAKKSLPPDALEALKQDVFSSHVYLSALNGKAGRPMRNEFRIPLVIV